MCGGPAAQLLVDVQGSIGQFCRWVSMSTVHTRSCCDKRSHTLATVAAATGELLGEQTVQVGRRGFGVLLRWARGLDGERVWALECSQ